MARRKLQEINAGSMADIAFLLLIFFLVTTTMDVDAGIGRNLPLKRELPPDFERPDVRERDVLEILANSNDQLMVEGQFIDISELEEIVIEYFTANDDGRENNVDMPSYKPVSIPICNREIANLDELLANDPENADFKREKEKWESKKKLCQEMPTKSYNEISKMAVIQLKNQANTSYGLYIEIQDVLKKVVNDLRVEKCEELWPGTDYFALKDDVEEDAEKIKMLRVLIPERIVEARIDR